MDIGKEVAEPDDVPMIMPEETPGVEEPVRVPIQAPVTVPA